MAVSEVSESVEFSDNIHFRFAVNPTSYYFQVECSCGANVLLDPGQPKACDGCGRVWRIVIRGVCIGGPNGDTDQPE